MLELPKRILAKARRSFRDALFRLHGRLRDTVTIQTKQGRLTLSTRDRGVGAQLFRDRQFEFDSSIRSLRFLKEKNFLSASDICMLDVGANIGLISTGLLLADEVQSAIAIEPEPDNFELLARNAEQNGLLDQMCCLHMAVSDEPSTLTMEISPSNSGDHRIRTKPVPGAAERFNESLRDSIEIRSMPLTQILDLPEVQDAGMKSPSLLWVDVQGYEGYVFRGGRSRLSQGVPTVSEVWPYGIRRAGMQLAEFTDIVSCIWTDYWVYRRQRFTRYPISVFDRLLEEIGSDGGFENVIFTRSV